MSPTSAAGFLSLALLIPSASPAEPPGRTDLFGDPLPAGALVRMGTVRWRTGEQVDLSSVLAKDGRTLFVGAGDAVRVFDLETGQRLRTIRVPETRVTAVALAPDGKVLASADFQGVRLWDADTGQPLRSLKAGPVRTVAFSPDGKRLITGGQDHDRSVRVFDPATGKEQLRLLWHGRQVSFVAVLPDGNTLVTASGVEAKVVLTDLATGEAVRTLESKNSHDAVAAVSPDGTVLAVAETHYRERRPNFVSAIRLLSLPAGQELRVIEGGARWTNGLAFSPDGKLLISAEEKAFHVWDVATGREQGSFPGGGARVCLTPDGQRLVSVGPAIRVWEVASGRELHPPVQHAGPVSSLAYSPDGKLLAACSFNDRAIPFWDAATGKLLGKLPGHEDYVRSVQFTPGGRLVSGGGDSTLRVWDVAAGREAFRFPLHEQRADEKPLQVLSLGVSHDGQRLAAACTGFDGLERKARLFAWNLLNGKLLGQREQQQGGFEFPAFSPDARAFTERDASGLALHDVLTGKELCRLRPAPQPDESKALGPETLGGPYAFSPDGKTLALRSSRRRHEGPRIWVDDHAIRLFDVETGRELSRIAAEPGYQGLAFSPEGTRLAAVTGRVLRVWDVATSRELWHSPELDTRPSSVTFSPDGTRLASGLNDTTILVWDFTPRK